MSQKGFAAVPLVMAALVVLAVVGAVVLIKMNSNPTQTSVSESTPQPEGTTTPNSQATTSPTTSSTLSSAKPAASTQAKTNCDQSKNVCFNVDNPVINIQEGYLEDANHWISRDLMLTGQGSGGYVVSLIGFPNQISERMPQQNFPKGGSQSVYLRAQKDVTKKGTYSGTISVKSLITGVTTSTNLTINYTDWTTSAIHADPAQIIVDCKIIDDPNDTSKRTQDCGKYDDHFIKFYYFKNDKTIELHLKKAQSSDSKSINLDTDLYHAKTLYKGQDVYSLFFYVDGFGTDVGQEPNATFTGWIQFIDQATQKELINIPYTIRVHAYGS